MPDTTLSELNSLLGNPRHTAPVWWPVRLARRIKLPPIIAGILAFVVLLTLYGLSGLIPWTPEALAAKGTEGVGEALFYAFSLAFLLTLTNVILPAAQRDLDELRPYLALDDEQILACRRTLIRHPRPDLLLASVIGGTFGLVHTWALGDSPLILINDFSSILAVTVLSRIAIWVLMFQLGFLLVANSHFFQRLGASYLHIDLYNPHKLYAFGRTALRPTLFLLGLQAAYPLLVLGQTALQPLSFIGLGASLALVLWLFFEPMHGVHRQLKATRARALADIDRRLASLWQMQGNTSVPEQSEGVDEATRLLDLRQHLHGAPTWPLGLAGARRILIYVIIPPLGWGITVLTDLWLQRLASGL